VWVTAKATVYAIRRRELALAKRTRAASKLQSPKPRQAQVTFMLARNPDVAPQTGLWLEYHRRRYSAGDRGELLYALSLWLECFQGLPKGPPKWMVDGFCEAIEKWDHNEATTLDEAFGVQRKHLSKQIGALRERNKWRYQIVACVEKLAQLPGKSRIEARLAKAAAELGLTEGFVRKVYYEPASVPWREILRRVRIS
jgi:hypothetical protein